MSTSAPAASTSGKDVFQKRIGYTLPIEKQRRESEAAGIEQPARKSTGKKLQPMARPGPTKGGAADGAGAAASEDHAAISLPSAADDGLDGPEPRESYVPFRDSSINFVKPTDTVYKEDDEEDADDFVHLHKKKASTPFVRDSAVGLIWNSDGEQLGVITDYTELSASSLFKPSAARSTHIKAQRRRMKTAKVTAVDTVERAKSLPLPAAVRPSASQPVWNVFAGYFSKDAYIVLTIFILALVVLIETTVIAFLCMRDE